MNNNSINKNNLYDNNLNTNDNKFSGKVLPKGSLSEQFIFFKEDILKDIKNSESKLSLKYDIQFNLNSNKINKINSKIEQLQQRIEYLTTAITESNALKERIDKISNYYSKLEESLILHDVRMKNINIKLTETIDKFDKILSESVIYPGVIGPKAKFKTFHELIDFVIFNLSQLLMFKEKISIDFKEYKYKTDSMMSNFQVKLNYLIKNANNFTTTSVRQSEKKMEQLLRGQLDEFIKDFDDFKYKFNAFSGVQEDKLINIIENSKKIVTPIIFNENAKKIEDLEKVIENLKENNKKIITEIEKLANNIERRNLNNSMNNNLNDIIDKTNQKGQKEDKTVNYYNINNKKATSIVKQYINGTIRENEMFSKRRSINFTNFSILEDIKEYNNINSKLRKSPMKKNLKKQINYINSEKKNKDSFMKS